jgi:hypothetical protein
MNLQALASSGHDPEVVMAVLRRRFNVATRRCPGEVYPYQIEASDDAGRARIRIPYFWSAGLWHWVYLIHRGDRP